MLWNEIDKLPPPLDELVLFCDQYYDFVLLGVMMNEAGDVLINVFSIFEIPEDFTITHWMAMPKPPRDEASGVD